MGAEEHRLKGTHCARARVRIYLQLHAVGCPVLGNDFSAHAQAEPIWNTYTFDDVSSSSARTREPLRIPEDCQIWAPRNRCANPIWNTSRRVSTPRRRPTTDKLRIAVLDFSHLGGEDLIGFADVDISSLSQDQVTEVRVPIVYTPVPYFPADMRVTVRLARPSPGRKTLFLVRHATSIWNESRRKDLGISAIFSEDHALSVRGLTECDYLRAQIRDCAAKTAAEVKKKDETRARFIQKFLGAQIVLCSPLSRAVQTAAVVLQEHPLIAALSPAVPGVREGEESGGLIGQDGGATTSKPTSKPNSKPNSKAKPIRLMSCLRERRNIGSKDCSSSLRGMDILESSQKFLNSEYRRKGLRDLRGVVDVNDATDDWWDAAAESERAFQSRIEYFVRHLRTCPETKIIMVGHSYWIRSFCAQLLSPRLRNQYGRLITDKVQNCGVVGCELNFEHTEPQIADISFMFGTKKLTTTKDRLCAPLPPEPRRPEPVTYAPQGGDADAAPLGGTADTTEKCQPSEVTQ